MGRRQWDEIDAVAGVEGAAISASNKTRPRMARLRKTHIEDGITYRTGQKHRCGGYYRRERMVQ